MQEGLFPMEFDPADRITHQPAWFKAALAAPCETRRLTVDGAGVNYFRWGNDDKDRPGLLFIHGNGAHARWFSFIAPLLTPHFNVASMDLPGMGDSDWRDTYTRDTFAHAIGSVAFDADLGPRPVLVGHSFGGFVTLIAGKHYSDRLGGVILADFTVRPKGKHREWFLEGEPRRPTRIYPDFETAVKRFRLAPPQDCANGYIFDYIAGHSLREVKIGDNPGRRPSDEAGWTWKFDPMIFNGLRMGDDHAEIYRSLKCPSATIYGEQSKDYEPEPVADLARIAPDRPISTVAGAQHHIMLDQPVGFASAVSAYVAQWKAAGHLSAAKNSKNRSAA